MKTKILLLLAFFFVANSSSAQDRKLIESYKQPESGIMLFPNKTFAAWTYMTVIRGYYQKRPDGVYLLKPQREPLFLVYGYHNDSIGKDKVRIRFANFEEGKNYIQYENGKTYSVFNDHPNCFSYKYIHTFDRKEVGNTLTLMHHIGYYDEKASYFFEGEGIKTTLQFSLGAYNDFLISYEELNHLKADIVFVPMEIEGEKGAFFHRGKWPEEELKMVKERLKEIPKEHLKRFFIPKEDPEKINEESISFLYAENIEPPTTLIVSKKENRVVGGSYTSKPFEDDEHRSYLQVRTQGSITDPKKLKVEPKTIFVSECERPSQRREIMAN